MPCRTSTSPLLQQSLTPPGEHTQTHRSSHVLLALPGIKGTPWSSSPPVALWSSIFTRTHLQMGNLYTLLPLQIRVNALSDSWWWLNTMHTNIGMN